MGIRNMQGTPAFLEYIGPRGRKRRKSCAFYLNGICYCDKAASFRYRCVGRMYCERFDDSENAKIDANVLINKINSRIKKKKTKEKTTKKDPNKFIKKSIIGKEYELLSLESNKIMKLKFVEEKDSNPFKGLYSVKSRMSYALRGKEIDSIIVVDFGNNKKKEYKILNIR